jgi:hypothetical protein
MKSQEGERLSYLSQNSHHGMFTSPKYHMPAGKKNRRQVMNQMLSMSKNDSGSANFDF